MVTQHNKFQNLQLVKVVSVNRDKMWGTWSLDFEKRNVYPLRIKATDIPRKGDPMTDTALLTMFLVDINEAPIINNFQFVFLLCILS